MQRGQLERLSPGSAQMVGDHLYEALTLKLGASYGFRGSASTLRGGTDVLVVDGNVDNGKLAAALTVVRKYWDGVAAGELEDAEIVAARTKQTHLLAFRYASSSALADFLLEQRNLGREIHEIDRYPAELSSVTKEDVRNTMTECHDHTVVSLVGNEAVIRAALREVGWQ